MRDFTLKTYKRLLEALEANGYTFLTFEEYCAIRQGTSSQKTLPEQYVIMRHDVDKRPEFSVLTAEMEAGMGVKASYYFRIGKESNRPECIKRIAQLGHEIGYHYEDMSLCKGDHDKAYAHFKESLEYFRQFYPIRTCCMHGAPTSRHDSRKLWEKYSYRDLQLTGEPYFDVDFNQVLYLTDTGRCWDGFYFSLRDRVTDQQQRWNDAGWSYHTTDEIINAVQAGTIAKAMMINTHPQRWTDKPVAWVKELVTQNVKNFVKATIIHGYIYELFAFLIP